MNQDQLPDHVNPIGPGEPFSFLCHRKVSCFTHCCRELELVLTPYDVLRLRRATGLHSAELHSRYIIEEQSPDSIFPSFYLSMVDDGKARCVFVRPEGCSIYSDRPGACRTYPVGRAAIRSGEHVQEHFVLLRELHCRGFDENTIQTVKSFMKSQELEPYNCFNDMLTEITQHEKIRQGMVLSPEQIKQYKLALFDLDSFRDQLDKNTIDQLLEVPKRVFEDDEALLEFGLSYIKKLLFD